MEACSIPRVRDCSCGPNKQAPNWYSGIRRRFVGERASEVASETGWHQDRLVYVTCNLLRELAITRACSHLDFAIP